jgi:hypothetical protein
VYSAWPSFFCNTSWAARMITRRNAGLLPAMANAALHPPSRYPREWKDGGGAFGRWYERQIVTSTS